MAKAAKKKEAQAAPAPAPKAEAANYINVDTAARLIRVTPRRVQQLVSEGWIKQPATGKYTVVGVVHGYIDFRDHVDRGAQQNSAATRLTNKREEQIELKMVRETGELIRAARMDALATVDEIAGGLRTDLYALPARLTADLPMRRKLEELIDDILSTAAKRATDARNKPSQDSGPMDAGEEDDA